MNDFLAELEKIANFSTDVVAPDDVAGDPMVPDTEPHVAPETVEQLQTANAEIPPNDADEQLPSNPEDDKALAEAIGQAQQEYEATQEQLAALEFEYAELEKTATITEQLPAMGALARLIDFSTNDSISEELQKLASDRLAIAMKDEEGYAEMLQKTAQELFEDEENLNQLYSPEGKAYVLEHLASFHEDEELEKIALEVGGILNHAQDIVGDYIHGARNLWKLEDQIKAAKLAVDAAKEVADQKSDLAANVLKVPFPDQEAAQAYANKVHDEYSQATNDLISADNKHQDLIQTKRRGQQVWFGGGATGAAGAFLGGKAIANHVNSNKEPQEQLYEKSASVTIKLENNEDIKGGKPTMASVVKDFLKIAGAAGLLELANNEDINYDLRKEAAATFNKIARMNRYDMEAEFEKVATQIYTEPELHEIVGGNHNDYLFDKIAYFLEAADMGADDLEKVAGADSVAAKGVGGALTDAKSNIEANLEQTKTHTEEVKNGELGTRKPDDMRGYNVINNPAAYKVDKTASAILEEAQMQKEAAYRAFVEADTFLKLNGIN